MLLDDATFQKFGYHLMEISKASHKKVVCSCPQCGQPYETQMRYYRDERLCKRCTNRQSITQNRNSDAAFLALEKHNKLSKEAGLSARGLPLFSGSREEYWKQYGETNRQRYNEYQRKRRQTLIGKASNRLRVAVRYYLRGKGGFSQLPYTPAELRAYIQTKLEERQYLCPMCGTSLKEVFDIDHRIPLSSAKTVEEVIALFALSNLDVLCPPCNQHKKRAKPIVY